MMKQIETIGAVEIELHKHRLGTMLEIRALLTPEQREEMTRLREDSRGLWRHALSDACELDLAALCPEADDRWSRKECLREHREEVTKECSDALGAARRARHEFHKGCPMHGESGCSGKCGPGCPMHGESGCPMHGKSGCPMHGESGCPMHGKPGCPKHRESQDAL